MFLVDNHLGGIESARTPCTTRYGEMFMSWAYMHYYVSSLVTYELQR